MCVQLKLECVCLKQDCTLLDCFVVVLLQVKSKRGGSEVLKGNFFMVEKNVLLFDVQQPAMYIWG